MTDSNKFILMSMSDPKTKKVAEALQNPTCKKILDYLADIPEASEGDLAKNLNLAPNTTHYNLKNLIEAGLIKKTKNFFWSKKGKRIVMYKLVNKSIIISPKNSDISKTLKSVLAVTIIGLALILTLVAIFNPENNNTLSNNSEIQIKQFASLSELNKFLEDNKISENRNWLEKGFGGEMMAEDAMAPQATIATGSEESFSETNVQVKGVDEADMIKTDGKYIYTLTGTTLTITEAYPPEEMKILSETEIENPINFYINEDKLIIFANEYTTYKEETIKCSTEETCPLIPNYDEPKVMTYIYDISNKKIPALEHKISISGNHVNSRMIGNYIYLISNKYAQRNSPMPLIEKDGVIKEMRADEVYYYSIPDYSFQYTNIIAINIKNGEYSDKTILSGSSNNIYVSKDNIYLTAYQYPNYGWGEEITEKDTITKTSISKISIDKDEIEFIATGSVPGNILNQFSMDEYENNFRIATTISGYSNNVDTSTNNMYILSEDLKLLGKIEGIAPGESIYSVRFMGKRAYMVTFRHVDPLFVIDLENPQEPKILGKLKIPGYSDYLHPYDETHLIGIGKEVDASIDADKVHTEGAVYYTAIQGVKLAIFDVSDLENPIEMHKVVIGDRGSDSPASYDHKAFLFDKEKNLLVIPVTVAELKDGQDKSEQGEFIFQGAYAYNISLDEGFQLKGKISHYDENDEEFQKSGYYFRGNKNIQRILYIGNTLYTFSNEMLKANNLDDLDEISSVELPFIQEEPTLYRYD